MTELGEWFADQRMPLAQHPMPAAAVMKAEIDDFRGIGGPRGFRPGEQGAPA
jgi:hypothetical protein